MSNDAKRQMRRTHADRACQAIVETIATRLRAAGEPHLLMCASLHDQLCLDVLQAADAINGSLTIAELRAAWPYYPRDAQAIARQHEPAPPITPVAAHEGAVR